MLQLGLVVVAAYWPLVLRMSSFSHFDSIRYADASIAVIQNYVNKIFSDDMDYHMASLHLLTALWPPKTSTFLFLK